MAKQSRSKKANPAGSGKVTPVQIAFIIDRYLSDNLYSSTLAAFRSEAAHLFSKAKGKQAPKGLLGLGDILDEYISLKEQRVMVEQDKRRVETALKGIQEVMRNYQSSAAVNGSTSFQPASPPPFLPKVLDAGVTPAASVVSPVGISIGSPPGTYLSSAAATRSTPLLLASSPPVLPKVATAAADETPTDSSPPLANPITGSPSGDTGNEGSVVKSTQPLLHTESAIEPNNSSIPALKCSAANKRKASKPPPKLAPRPKRSCVLLAKGRSTLRGKTAFLQATSTSNTEQNVENVPVIQPTSNCDQMIKSPVVKSLFKQQADSQANSSPKTPPQLFLTQTDNPVSPQEDASLRTPSEIAPGKCSIISSETVLGSPFRQTGYYAVERSYHVTSSPFKSSPKKLAKRELIKGRLHFGELGGQMNLEKPVATVNYTHEDVPEPIDYDLPDLDIFNGDFSFTELLADIDLECKEASSTSQLAAPDSIIGSEHNANLEFMADKQNLPCSSLSKAIRALSDKNMNISGPNSITSMTTISKRITILSPAKSRNAQTNSPAK